jgi:hypothetical protein
MNWEKFVDSFATPGGSIFFLFVFTMLLLGVNLHILHHANAYSDAEVTVFQTILANFTGALLLALQSRAKPSNGTTPKSPDNPVDAVPPKA